MRARPVFAVVLLLSLLALSQSPGTNQQSAATQEPILSMPSLGLAPPRYKAEFTPVISNGVHRVSWDKGHLVSFSGEMKEPVAMYDTSGKWLFENPLTFENAIQTYIQDAAPTGSDTAVVAASAVNADGAVADLIIDVGKDGIRHAIRTSPFYPERVCATDDQKVWAYGTEIKNNRAGEPRAHYPMLREYSFEKGELRSTLDRASVRPPQGVPVTGTQSDVYMRCAPGRVVLVSGPTNELMEYDLAASKLTRWPLAPLPERFYINGAAVTAAGEVYISIFRPGQNALTGLVRLSVNSAGTAEWTPLIVGPPSGGKFFLLLGNDGDDLVYSLGRSAPTLYWARAARTEVAK